MEAILAWIMSHVMYAPYVIFGLLLLAGLNVPVSEDAMLFISGVLAAKNPEYLVHLFLGVYLGAYLSDIIAYSLGRFLGPKLWRIRFFAKMVTPEKIDKVAGFYARNGFLTLLIGRFIPFGVRNALFLSAGFTKMNFTKFAIYDWIATTLSCSLFFSLYYKYGETVIEYVKKGNMILFSIFLIGVIFYFVKQKKKARTQST